ncbi:uncharacterized protein [Physcomitrium patens]|uniref:uncharacterized protein isoform X5 n=1 Tax=Physcomitrium patens TaxID=3218 RepID=UPI003CCDA889
MIPLVLFPCWFIRSVQHLLEKHPWQLLSIDFTLSLGRVFERFRRSGDLSMMSCGDTSSLRVLVNFKERKW